MANGPSRIPRPIHKTNQLVKQNTNEKIKPKRPAAKHKNKPVTKADKENHLPRNKTDSPVSKKRKTIAVSESKQQIGSRRRRNFLKTNLTKHPKMKSNRLDKRDTGFDHTYIVFKGLDGNRYNARMLNTVPEEDLMKKGFSQEQCDSFFFHEKSNPVSVDGGLILGEGGCGIVKFAEVFDPETNKTTIVAEKKIKVEVMAEIEAVNEADAEARTETLLALENSCENDFDTEFDASFEAKFKEKFDQKIKDKIESIRKEVTLQQKAGNATVKCYGLSETIDKNDEKECVVFMEIAKGVEGFTSVFEEEFKLTEEARKKIACNLVKETLKMHEQGVYHLDLKWENIYINPEKDYEVKIIDFGLGTHKKNERNISGRKRNITYMPPEIIKEGTVLESEKIDVFCLGIMLVDILRTDYLTASPSPFRFQNGWTEVPEHDEILIDEALNKIPLDDIDEDILRLMLHHDPNQRLSLDAVPDLLTGQ